MVSRFWVAQTVGVLALLLVVWTFLAPDRKRILQRQIMAAVVFVLHFVLLSAYTGAAMNASIIFRNGIFERRQNSVWANNQLWLYLFLSIPVIVTLLTWAGWISLFPLVGIMLGTYAMWHNNPARLRLYFLASSVMWIPYNIVVRSYPGTIAQLVIAGSVLFAIRRFDRPKHIAVG